MTWAEHVAAWSQPPVDDVGYLPSADLMVMSDDQLDSTIREMARVRYTGWRNHDGSWRRVLRLDDTHGKDVLDFGCGVGMEARELQEAGNRVSLADLSADNLSLAYRVLRLGGHSPELADRKTFLVTDQDPYFCADPASFDVVHCAGVLHHIPWARQIMERFHEVLRTGGEVRLMLYSDRGWQIATGQPVPAWDTDVRTVPGFAQFVRYFDGVGEYADWYDLTKIERLFGDLFIVVGFDYLTQDARYCAVVLTPRKSRS